MVFLNDAACEHSAHFATVNLAGLSLCHGCKIKVPKYPGKPTSVAMRILLLILAPILLVGAKEVFAKRLIYEGD